MKSLKNLSFLQQFSLLSFIAFLIIGSAITYIRTVQIRQIFFDEQKRNLTTITQEQATKILSSDSFDSDDSEKWQEHQENFRKLTELIQLPEILRIHFWAKDGTIVYSTVDEYIGQKYPENHHLNEAVEKKESLAEKADPDETGKPPLPSGIELLEIYIPIFLETAQGAREVLGVAEAYVRLEALNERIVETQTFTIASVVGSFVFLYLLLFGIARAASETIRRQSQQLEEYAKGLEEKVKERTKELEEAQKKELALKDEFVFIASHELKTPVTAINGFLEMIFEENPPSAIKSSLEAIEVASQNLKQLVEDLLEVARSEAGRLEVKTEPLNICIVIDEVSAELLPLSSQKSLKLENLCPKAPTMVLADKGKIQEILLNLVGNAIKFTPQKGRVGVSHQTKGKEVIIEVSDTGIGIPEGEQKHIFEKFWRGENARQAPGTGLGLFITKMLVEKMGGRIWFESEVGKGSTFHFSLPIVK